MVELLFIFCTLLQSLRPPVSLVVRVKLSLRAAFVLISAIRPQEQEIYQKCIRGPPNRTIWPSAAECGKLSQPHRSSSTTGLTSLSTFSSEVDSVTRCNSVSSRYVYEYCLEVKITDSKIPVFFSKTTFPHNRGSGHS